MGTNEDLTNDDRAVRLLREAMDRTTAELPPLPDLAGPALAQGRRRKARLRAVIGGGVLALAVLGVAGAAALPAGSGKASGAGEVAAAPSPTAPPQATPSSSGPPPPVHIEPSPGESSMAQLPPAERVRQESFQDQAVTVLQDLLPDAVGLVQRTDLAVRQYQATKDGSTFTLLFSVRPAAGPGTGERECLEIKGQTCKRATLPGGIEATASTSPEGDGNVTVARVSFRYGASTVLLYVGADSTTNTSAPVTKEQLLEVVRSPAFLGLVKTADANPMEKKQTVVQGG
ncbi:hypothetical protein [Streptomyces xanthophaeus]|uniref:Uncharacterized protein n=1 Tax=Streptomyces xanthophaeus TaxID=67385 RepID=A0A919H0U4_9ACTN|nr:hypothetical protein [Streptomyces xanthophaeus]GHI88240.1 hypothetical protein Sxan_56040 [Streptomyces xanthophaeus]